MRLFEEFVDALNNQPERNYGGSLSVNGSKTALMGEVNAGNMGIKAKMLEKLEDTHLFVLSMNAIFPKEIYTEKSKAEDGRTLVEVAKGADRAMDLDVAPPFQTCWFQFSEPGHGYFNGIVDTKEGVKIFGMWLHEVAAHEYLLCFVMEDKLDPAMHRFRFAEASQTKNHEIWHTIALWLQPFGRDITTGTMKTSSRVKFKRPKTGEKVLHKIRKVVMIYPKNMSVEEMTEAKKEGVDFSHRFEVRAFWRRLFYLDGRVDVHGNKVIDFNRVGKNRQGEYCVAGRTFVNEGERGPKHLPLIKKTRVVLGEKKDE